MYKSINPFNNHLSSEFVTLVFRSVDRIRKEQSEINGKPIHIRMNGEQIELFS